GGGWDAFVTEINAAGSAIVYSTFLGGSGYDYGLGIAVDGVANAYVTGESSSASFPGVGGGSIQPANAGDGDAFVVKIGSAAEIPAVSRWALAALALALGGMTLARLRRRRGPDRPEA
ncbi:MAG TPA: IPTL-CTERM sorting domain-containing protein, partial [Thermoanaerobaculia bacterium]|nr:IPTL-CTERM sorting domain-containing protein [Thermoanaerobaculia bacterium]